MNRSIGCALVVLTPFLRRWCAADHSNGGQMFEEVEKPKARWWDDE